MIVTSEGKAQASGSTACLALVCIGMCSQYHVTPRLLRCLAGAYFLSASPTLVTEGLNASFQIYQHLPMPIRRPRAVFTLRLALPLLQRWPFVSSYWRRRGRRMCPIGTLIATSGPGGAGWPGHTQAMNACSRPRCTSCGRWWGASQRKTLSSTSALVAGTGECATAGRAGGCRARTMRGWAGGSAQGQTYV